MDVEGIVLTQVFEELSGMLPDQAECADARTALMEFFDHDCDGNIQTFVELFIANVSVSSFQEWKDGSK